MGDLTIRDKTRSVVIDGPTTGRFRTPGAGAHRVQGTTTINRQDFGVSFNGPFEGIGQIGDEVTISIAIEAVEQ